MIVIPLATLAVLLTVMAGVVVLRIVDFMRELVGPPDRATPPALPRPDDPA